jgi:hypothetical protein
MDDSVRKKQGTARARVVPTRSHDGLSPNTGRTSGVDDLRAHEGMASVVSLNSSRKARPRASVRKDGTPSHVEGHIGKQLKAVYDDVLNQPIPDRFLDLLSQLETKTTSKESGDQ